MTLAHGIEPVADRFLRGSGREHYSKFFRASGNPHRLTLADEFPRVRTLVDWDLIDRAIQVRFLGLTERVKSLVQDVETKVGSHRARSIGLSSYRVFGHQGGEEFDPVYAGITISEDENTGSIRIAGDISGEESGRIHFDEGCELFVPVDFASIRDGAIEVADRLAARSDIVVQALRMSRPEVWSR
jgi:hypothetical protein